MIRIDAIWLATEPMDMPTTPSLAKPLHVAIEDREQAILRAAVGAASTASIPGHIFPLLTPECTAVERRAG